MRRGAEESPKQWRGKGDTKRASLGIGLEGSQEEQQQSGESKHQGWCLRNKCMNEGEEPTHFQ